MAIEKEDIVAKEKQTDSSTVEQPKSAETEDEKYRDFKEIHDAYNEAADWASEHGSVMVDYFNKEWGGLSFWLEKGVKPFKEWWEATRKKMEDHLLRGQELGLNETEQIIIDSLYGWIPHDYEDNYVTCAREVTKVLLRYLPEEPEESTVLEFLDYFHKVIPKVEKLAAKHDVDFDTSDYSLTLGYLWEWMMDIFDLEIDNPWG